MTEAEKSPKKRPPDAESVGPREDGQPSDGHRADGSGLRPADFPAVIETAVRRRPATADRPTDPPSGSNSGSLVEVRRSRPPVSAMRTSPMGPSTDYPPS